MTLDGSGNLLVGRTSDLGAGARVNIESANGEADILAMRYFNATAGKYWKHAIDSNNGYFLLNNGLAGVTITTNAMLNPVIYRNSMTIQKTPELNNGFEKNRQYYISKWGGQPTQETFSTPFNQ
jgi:hypothetical protein